MKPLAIVKAAIALLVLPLFLATSAGAGEIKYSKLPGAVRKSIEKKFPHAKVLKAVKEEEEDEEDDEAVYEVSLKHEGRTIDVSLTPGGKFLEIEEEIAIDRLPRDLVRAIAAKYPKATIGKAEKVSKGKGGTVSYEVSLTLEVVLTPGYEIVAGNGKANAQARKHEREDDKRDRKAGKGEREDDGKSKARAKKRGKEEEDDDDKDDEEEEDEDEDDDEEEDD